ncbi:hypothetical protein BP5796_03395 [Coleophoma crateriformis]|uniref:Uncharacterized protein n=1 Tax=Coleophoma crateriformis TaxID=565419 RepID=A0A3D8SNE3_9HELO|nr:hypothetical protein BP5796_03395 [Coleophoma crateriformis]
MAPSYHSSSYPTARDESPTLLNRIIAALPRNLATQAQELLDKYSYSPVSTSSSRSPKTLRQARAGFSFSFRKLLSVPYLLVAIWIVVLLWGERWVFESSIAACQWGSWERWPRGATPHHLVLLADPQLTDPHSYPDRPWPLSTFTIWHTDNYLKRGYIQLQKQLFPDTLFFLGDLFDGGREWKTTHGNTDDPAWTKGMRPQVEEKWLKTWNRKYGEKFWLKEYDRFGRIFFNFWNLGTTEAGVGQRGRRIIASLPGNHDLGFGAMIKIPVRNRFETYFGEGNRVDVIANHTFVSIDGVSLSAGSSGRPLQETINITAPVEEFLDGVQAAKRKAVARELRFLAGEKNELHLPHTVEEAEDIDVSKMPTSDPGEGAPELPTILLTHVPLYRNPDTDCGPMREHGKAISISRGYQYQNVLSEEDSVKVVSKVGNVVSVFSGDDHDYCELVHPENKNHAREITVKSMSWTMGVRRPGFLMLSMWNPITPEGKPSHSMHTGHGAASAQTSPTFESHLCLLPDQLGIFMRYGVLLAITFIALIMRAVLTPFLGLDPFAAPLSDFEQELSILPTSTRDTDREDKSPHRFSNSSTSSTSSNSAGLASRSAAARTRSVSPANGYGFPQAQSLVRNAVPPFIDSAGYYVNPYGGVKYPEREEPIKVKAPVYDKVPRRNLTKLEIIGRELYHSIYRVAWLVGGWYLWLAWFG